MSGLSPTTAPHRTAVARAAEKLLARANEPRNLAVEIVRARVGLVVGKYLTRDDPAATPAQVEQFVDQLHADDLCLALACERGDDAAWSDLMERFGATVRSAARGASQSEAAAEELMQSVWAELYGWRTRAAARAGGDKEEGSGDNEGDAGATVAASSGGKLAHYSGRGSLGGWLRAVVGQLAIDRHRQTARLIQMEDEADGDRLLLGRQGAPQIFPLGTSSAARDPERAVIEDESVAALHDALAEAIARLTADERLLIKLYYFDNLRLREAGAVLGVHEATASRRLTNLHRQLRESVQHILMTAHGWDRSEVDGALSETARRFDGDLGRLLNAEVTAAREEKSTSG